MTVPNGPAIIDVLTHRIPALSRSNPREARSRAQAPQPPVAAGNVYVPNPRPLGQWRPDRAWFHDFVRQLTVFPHGAHDDDVDAFTQLVVRWQEPPPMPVVLW